MIQFIKNLIQKVLSFFQLKKEFISPTPTRKPGMVFPGKLTLSQRAYWIAQQEVGISETPGIGNTQRILDYHKCTTLKATNDSVAWCSSFVNWAVQSAGGVGTKDAMARSWMTWGKRVYSPQEGDIVIFNSPSRGPFAAHVAFFVSLGPTTIKVLGGNQNDSVCFSEYPNRSMLQYRRSIDG
jgi:uncharacterized protein (TIGR02594 family)